MSKHEHLHEPTGQFWFNSRTGVVEEGPQSLAVDRVGPFATREEAARAPQILAERAKAWNSENDED
jgi:hypothetical protein